MYSRQLLDHFERPRHAGVLQKPDATVQVENPVCGDVLKLMATLEQGRIAEIRFQAKGCVPAMACGSAVTELLVGRTLSEAETVNREDVVQLLGDLPEASTHAAHLAVDAAGQLVRALNRLRPKFL